MARVGETLSALLAFSFLLGLPFPPDAGHAPQWVYLAGVVISTLVLAWWVGRGGRPAWYAITGVAAVVLGPLLIHLPGLLTMFHFPEGVTPLVTGGLLVLYALGQVIALACAIIAIKRGALHREPVAPAT